MKFGLALPQFGHFADPQHAVTVARAAEAMGYDSLWVGDRILVPQHPRDRYPGGDGSIPPGYAKFLDPLVLLTAAALVTERARLGTSTLNALWQPPLLLARSLATLDQLSGGRVDVGLGLGWSSDEYQAVGVPWAGRGARLEQTLDVLEAAWDDDEVVEHDGELWTVPRSTIAAKPAQRPRPPVLLGGFSAASRERVGRRADGWLGVAMPVPAAAAVWKQIREAAESAGRDPQMLRMVTRLNPVIVATPAPADQVPRVATLDQFTGYVRALAGAGGHELLVDLQHTATGVPEMLDLAQRILDDVSDLRAA